MNLFVFDWKPIFDDFEREFRHIQCIHIHLLRIFVGMFCMFFLPLFKVNSDFSLSNWLYIHIYINYIFAINYKFCSKFRMNSGGTLAASNVDDEARRALSASRFVVRILFYRARKNRCCGSVDCVKVSVSSRATNNNQLNKESV